LTEDIQRTNFRYEEDTTCHINGRGSLDSGFWPATAGYTGTAKTGCSRSSEKGDIATHYSIQYTVHGSVIWVYAEEPESGKVGWDEFEAVGADCRVASGLLSVSEAGIA